MTCSASSPEDLLPRSGADGSFSLFSSRFGEGFHGAMGALSEARAKFVAPAQLERFSRGQRLRVVDVGFGLGTNSAALREAAQARGLTLEIWGLELDPAPLRQALAAAAFRRQWQPDTLELLDQLLEQGRHGGAELLWGDARQRLPELLGTHGQAGRCDLVLLDAFSPQRCPELWSLEFLGQLALLLQPQGRLLSYCCAAAVRHSLREAHLQLASIRPPAPPPGGAGTPWSVGTAASPTPLSGAAPPDEGPLRPLSAMELAHLATRAAEPYRDPSGRASSTAILAARREAQAASGAPSTTAWRRQWGLEPAPRRAT
jgi:tRNA U34 5-methylaminomethyl-2-thiouridine-forming methyltransferase MnmC